MKTSRLFRRNSLLWDVNGGRNTFGVWILHFQYFASTACSSSSQANSCDRSELFQRCTPSNSFLGKGAKSVSQNAIFDILEPSVFSSKLWPICRGFSCIKCQIILCLCGCNTNSQRRRGVGGETHTQNNIGFLIEDKRSGYTTAPILFTLQVV